jgi:hypothetical protein
VGGVITGGILASLSGGGCTGSVEDGCEGFARTDLSGPIIIGTTILGGLGGLVIGPIVGTIKGSTVNYVFREPPLDTVAKQTPLFRKGTYK